MGTAAYRGRGFKGRAGVRGEKPIGAARCRKQHNEASCPPTPLRWAFPVARTWVCVLWRPASRLWVCVWGGCHKGSASVSVATSGCVRWFGGFRGKVSALLVHTLESLDPLGSV